MSGLPLHVEDQIRARFRDLHIKLTDDLTLMSIEMQEESKPRMQSMIEEVRKHE